MNHATTYSATKLRTRGVLKTLATRFTNKPRYVRITLIVFFIYFVLQSVLHTVPFFWILNNSLKTTEEFFESSSALTQTWSFGNYLKVFSSFQVKGGVTYFEMLFNSLWISFLFVFVNILSSVILAYAVARFNFPGRKFLYGVAIFIRTIPIVGTSAASFKLKYAFGMINNPGTIWISWAMGFDFTFIVLHGIFKGIGFSYSEAARIDGAGNLTVLLKIIMPQALPAILALSISALMGQWNNYDISQIQLFKFPNLAYGLFIYQTESAWDYDTKAVFFAATVLTALPVIIIYTFNQNLVIKNVAVGGLKG